MFLRSIDRFFQISIRRSSIGKEIRAGLTTFFSMAYIINVNPLILSQTGMSFSALITSTVLVSFFSSLTMSLYANKPYALAPGLGINGFFTYTMVLQMGIPFEQALGATFLSGVIFLLLSLFKVRDKIIYSVPSSLKHAMCAGIGLFIGFIGGKQVYESIQWTADFGSLPFLIPCLLALVSIGITSFIAWRKVQGGFFLSIIFITFVFIFIDSQISSLSLVQYSGLFSAPDFSLIGAMDVLGALKLSLLPACFSLAFVDLFESLGTLMSLESSTSDNLKQVDKTPITKPLITDALGTVFAGVLGTSSITTYLESMAGIKEGGRTGLTSLVTACMFLPFMFFAPLISLIPAMATAPILIIIGILFLQPLKKIKWRQWEEVLPCLITVSIIPLTLSITNGLIGGFISYTFIQIIRGEARKLPLTLYIINVFCVISLIIEFIVI